MPLSSAKPRLRTEARARRAAFFSTPQYSVACAQIVQRLAQIFDQLPQQKANILAFWPFRGEPDILSFVLKQSAQANVYFPRVDGDTMAFHLWQVEAKMEVSRFGVLEPSHSSARFEAGTGVILVPGLGFGDNGARIGYGGGFYDKFLASPQAHDLLRLGICFSSEILPDLTPEAHDQCVHWLVTESDYKLCNDFRPKNGTTVLGRDDTLL